MWPPRAANNRSRLWMPRSKALASIKASVGALGGAVIVSVFLLAEADAIRRTPLPWALILAGWWLSPLVVYCALCRTIIGALAIGAGFILAAAACLAVTYSSEDSTAGIGLLLWPVLLWPGVTAALAVETLLQRLRGHT